MLTPLKLLQVNFFKSFSFFNRRKHSRIPFQQQNKMATLKELLVVLLALSTATAMAMQMPMPIVMDRRLGMKDEEQKPHLRKSRFKMEMQRNCIKAPVKMLGWKLLIGGEEVCCIYIPDAIPC